MARVFLTLVGAAYLLLGLWCASLPARTSQAVGFDLKAGSGQSEYLVIYGGLQLALGIIFLRPLFNSEALAFALQTCVTIHGCIVLFRTISFFLYTGIGTTTYTLAVVEWFILLGSALLLWKVQPPQ